MDIFGHTVFADDSGEFSRGGRVGLETLLDTRTFDLDSAFGTKVGLTSGAH